MSISLELTKDPDGIETLTCSLRGRIAELSPLLQAAHKAAREAENIEDELARDLAGYEKALSAELRKAKEEQAHEHP
jgi:hypothetical protein